MRLLVVASRFPFPIQKGDKLRLYHQLKLISAKADIYLFACSTTSVDEADRNEISKFCKEVFIYELSKKEMFLNTLSALFSGLPFQVGLFTNNKIKTSIRSFAERHKVERIYCQLIRMAENVRSMPQEKTIDYMDAFGFGMKKRASMGGFIKKMIYSIEAKRVKKYEFAIYFDFQHHTVITNQDKERIDLPQNSMMVVPNGVDFDFFTKDGGVEEFDIVFVGNMGYLPNIDAACVLVKKILPIANKKSGKEYSVLIAGARPSPEIIDLAKYNNVTVAGWMEDIRGAYKSGKMFVAPIHKGIGQQNKILEAMSMNLPCIVNRSVANGLHLQENKHCLLAESPEEFADMIIKLDNDEPLRLKMAATAKKMITEEFNWKHQTEELVDLLTKI